MNLISSLERRSRSLVVVALLGFASTVSFTGSATAGVQCQLLRAVANRATVAEARAEVNRSLNSQRRRYGLNGFIGLRIRCGDGGHINGRRLHECHARAQACTARGARPMQRYPRRGRWIR